MRTTVILLAAIAVLAGTIAKSGNGEAHAETVRIQHYAHQGCVIGGVRYLPDYAHMGLVATFRLPEQSQHCHEMIDRSSVSCEWATDFQSTNPQGHPWSAGEKDSRCFSVFRDEISHCVSHYERQRSTCDRGSQTQQGGMSDECIDAGMTMGEHMPACAAGDSRACDAIERLGAFFNRNCI